MRPADSSALDRAGLPLRWLTGTSPVLLAAPLLAGSALLPAPASMMVALVAIIALGVPHGALDGEIARDVLRPRWGWRWFPVFSAPYLALSASVLVAWHLAPLATLAGFLLASIWHFGTEDAGGASPLEQIVRGGLPVAVPTLAHPGATALLFSVVTGRAMAVPPAWLTAGALAWLALATLWCAGLAVRRRVRVAAVPATLVCGFLALPPLTAFAIYFVCVHAPAHTAALIRDARRARRVQDARSALRRAMPLTALTLLLGAALWPFYDGAIPERLLALTLQGLAALTLPHMLLDVISTRPRRVRSPSSSASRHAA